MTLKHLKLFLDKVETITGDPDIEIKFNLGSRKYRFVDPPNYNVDSKGYISIPIESETPWENELEAEYERLENVRSQWNDTLDRFKVELEKIGLKSYVPPEDNI